MTSHWLHGNSIPKIGCHYFWPGLISLPKNTLPVYGSYISIEEEAWMMNMSVFSRKVYTVLWT
jgi:hypothetical protein